MRGCSRRVDSSFLAGLITGGLSTTCFRVQGRFTLHANSPSFGLRFLWQISLCVCVSPGNPFVLSFLRLLFFFSAGLLNSFSILQFVPRLGCASTVRFVVCSICIRFRSVTGTGSLVRDTLSPYLSLRLCFGLQFPAKIKYISFFSSFLSFLFFLLSFLFFLSFRPCLKTCPKKNKKLHLSFFSVLNFSAWSISNVLIFFSLLLIFFFNWILSF